MKTESKRSARYYLVIAFSLLFLIIYFNEKRRKINRYYIKKNRKVEIGVTIGCRRNIKSSLDILDYGFTYKYNFYVGTVRFNKDKRGDICEKAFFKVEFDSINPNNNNLLLDSPVIDK